MTRLLRNPPTTGEMRRLLSFLQPHRKRMAVALVALGFSAGLGLVFPWMLQNLINGVFLRRDAGELNRIAGFLVIIFLLRSFFSYLEGYWLAAIGEHIVFDLRNQTYAHLQSLSLRFFTERRTGELLSRLASDVTLMRTALTSNIASFLYQLITFIGSLALMISLNGRLALLILSLTPLLVLIAVIFGRRLSRLSTRVQDQLAQSVALAEEALSNVRVVKAFTREPHEIARYQQQTALAFASIMRLIRLRVGFGPLVSFLSFAALTGILWFGGQEVLAGRLTSGAMVAILVYGVNMGSALGSFTGLYTQLQEASGAVRRLFELLDEPAEIADMPGAASLPPTQGRIAFERVSFAYPGGRSQGVLHDLELEVRPGEVLAIVGPSGAGKSTLFNLIPRFYDPTSGCIRIDGCDLRQVTLASLRAQIGLVSQETQLFSGSVRDNIRYGKLEASEAELEAAAHSANADEFISRLPDGYETLVGERGVKLSGGQRQRIAIARALLKNPRILLLDEATSSLDSEAEGLVQEALERLMRDRTTLIIAHRLSTIQRADRIIVLDEGRLIESGSHAELLQKGGLYAYLYRLQFRNS